MNREDIGAAAKEAVLKLGLPIILAGALIFAAKYAITTYLGYHPPALIWPIIMLIAIANIRAKTSLPATEAIRARYQQGEKYKGYNTKALVIMIALALAGIALSLYISR